MSSSLQTYPSGVPYREPRPRSESSAAGTLFGALLGLGITENPIGAIVGGAIGSAVSKQPLPLEAAIRAFFTHGGLPVISFYRLGPYAAMVLFRYRDQFWTVLSHAPAHSDWTPDKLDDWLYGDIVENLLPNKIHEIEARLTA